MTALSNKYTKCVMGREMYGSVEEGETKRRMEAPELKFIKLISLIWGLFFCNIIMVTNYGFSQRKREIEREWERDIDRKRKKKRNTNDDEHKSATENCQDRIKYQSLNNNQLEWNKYTANSFKGIKYDFPQLLVTGCFDIMAHLDYT
ncbi:CLUMA_CG009589, isoform A [Clunio marinus]|uniref:CLUMA_CG009589, isoform A n=1 Tax=Clunio marinus TaxID=568069 RepID=A0A1J1I7C3_9DIPT|nr:CLUMA_CG009589, isoform A [Clunio marinus]